MDLRRFPLLVVLASALAVPAAASLPFVEDDYPAALAAARQRHVPIFLEAWAPWCHTCRSMRANVYPDPRLARFAERFVWLSIDTEKAVNAGVVERYPVGAWPSMYVVDPVTETVEKRWTGSATVEQLERFLGEALAPAAGPGAAASDPLAAPLARADRLYGAAAWDAAATAFANLVERAPEGWPALPRAADAYVFALVKAEREAECAQAARALLPKIAGTPSYASVAATGLDCAVTLGREATGRAAAIAELEGAVKQAIELPGLAVDDRSGLYASLVGARDDAGDAQGKRAAAAAWIELLEASAARAATPDARAVYDSHRLTAYLEIGEPQRAIPMLEASERDLPGDYNPPARLAVAYQAMKEHRKALAASDRAVAKAYGPRRLGILRTRAQIQEALGDHAAALATLRAAITEGEALAAGQRSERMLATLRRDLEALVSPRPAAS